MNSLAGALRRQLLLLNDGDPPPEHPETASWDFRKWSIGRTVSDAVFAGPLEAESIRELVQAKEMEGHRFLIAGSDPFLALLETEDEATTDFTTLSVVSFCVCGW